MMSRPSGETTTAHDDVHARLKERAALEQTSLSDFVARELGQLVRYRTNAEIIEAARARGPVVNRDEIVAALREDRDTR